MRGAGASNSPCGAVIQFRLPSADVLAVDSLLKPESYAYDGPVAAEASAEDEEMQESEKEGELDEDSDSVIVVARCSSAVSRSSIVQQSSHRSSMHCATEASQRYNLQPL